MARKSRRKQTTPATTVRPAGSRRSSRRGAPQADFTDESQYVHVRGDLIRIGLLAFVLFTVATLLFMYRLFLRGLSLRYVLIPIALVNGLLLASGQFQWLYLLISVAVGAMLWLVFRNGREAWDLTVGALALWVVVMAAVNLSIPGASYLATWPLLFALVAIILIFSGIHDPAQLLV